MSAMIATVVVVLVVTFAKSSPSFNLWLKLETGTAHCGYWRPCLLLAVSDGDLPELLQRMANKPELALD